MQLLWVGLGSALGGMLRYLVGLWISGRVEAGLPIATLVVNLLGSLLLGCLMGILGRIEGPSEALRLTLGIGLCGGFTTFSTLSWEVVSLFTSGSWQLALLYLLITLLGGLLLCLMGYLFCSLTLH
ncbi:fluoride efflux transporter CrcB [Porphyromonas sp. COT-239 OH1446]|uniref:fluoride efflux transporter CrcB n=1 Tax=Porphyromonas sp. COT-239 OH1446 TaxID=1515613 RepID=UPI00052B66B1|nr:fluoride efflux transporter CrcB [Porphyromonas sp. COT-239 OH1446]KGN70185.1 hypothetical protein HQ37_03830 [Porphyromonas sp. COT-239 OH1446]